MGQRRRPNRGRQPGGVVGLQKALCIGYGEQFRRIGRPVDAIDDDGGVRGDGGAKVGVVPLGVGVRLRPVVGLPLRVDPVVGTGDDAAVHLARLAQLGDVRQVLDVDVLEGELLEDLLRPLGDVS